MPICFEFLLLLVFRRDHWIFKDLCLKIHSVVPLRYWETKLILEGFKRHYRIQNCRQKIQTQLCLEWEHLNFAEQALYIRVMLENYSNLWFVGKNALLVEIPESFFQFFYILFM